MIDRVRSLYLRNEKKYDKWGAQGKLLATLEVFRKEGVVMDAEKLQKFVNLAFPRTFSCQRVPGGSDSTPSRKLLNAYLESLNLLFADQGVPPAQIERMALEETAERFCLDAEFLKAYLK